MLFRSNIVRLGRPPVALLQQVFVVFNHGEMIFADLRTQVNEDETPPIHSSPRPLRQADFSNDLRKTLRIVWTKDCLFS